MAVKSITRIRNRFRIAGAAAAFVVLTMSWITLEARLESRRIAADEKTATVLRAVDLSVDSVFSNLEAVLSTALTEHPEDITPNTFDEVSARLNTILAGAQMVRTVILVDGNGIVVADGRDGMPAIGIDVSDRRYFQVHLERTTPDGAVFIDDPVASRVDGLWSVPLSRAIVSAGELKAVAVTSLSVDALVQSFREIASDQSLRMRLSNHEGTILAHWPVDKNRVGETLENGVLLNAIRLGDLDGNELERDADTGEIRRVHYRTQRSTGLTLAISHPQISRWTVMSNENLIWLIIAVVAAGALLAGGDFAARAHTKISAAQAEAIEADSRKSRFLAGTSHELRTPLNAIMGYSEILKDDLLGLSPPDTYKSYGGSIHESAAHLLNLVNDLLDLNALDRDSLILEESWFDPRSLIDRSIRMSKSRFGAGASVRFFDDLSEDRVQLKGDDRRILQALINLLGNATQHTPHDGTITLALRNGAAGGLVLEVSDTGPGLSKGVLARIGQSFHLSNDAYIRSHTGAGMGLAITSGIVRQHDATLEMGNREDRTGAVARIVFPADRVRRSPGETAFIAAE